MLQTDIPRTSLVILFLGIRNLKLLFNSLNTFTNTYLILFLSLFLEANKKPPIFRGITDITK